MKRSSSQFIFGVLTGLLGACLLAAIIGQRHDKGKVVGSRELTVAHALATTHPVHKGIEEFGRQLEELSGGKFTIKIFPSEQLGNETECLEKLQQGSIDIAKTSAAPVGSFVPVYQLFSLPYLFRGRDHYWEILDGDIGEELLDELGINAEGKPSGLTGLGYFDAGSRNFYTIAPVHSPADLKGLKIRVQKDPVAEDMVRAMGGSAVSMSFGELYTSLKQGGVDGAENNPPTFLTSSQFEVCQNYVLDAHSRVPDLLVASKKLWDSLNDTERGWYRQAAKKASVYQRQLWAEETEQAIQKLKEGGVTIREVDLTPFREAVKPVIDKYAKGKVAELVNRIQSAP